MVNILYLQAVKYTVDASGVKMHSDLPSSRNFGSFHGGMLTENQQTTSEESERSQNFFLGVEKSPS